MYAVGRIQMLLTAGAIMVVANRTDATAQPEYSHLEYSHTRPQPQTSPPGEREADTRGHDGFFLRTLGGVGHLKVWGRETYSGLGASAGVACGWIVDANLAFYGQMLDTSILLSPSADNADGHAPGSASLIGGGPGLAYYWEPVNIHVSGALAVSGIVATPSSGGGAKSTGMGLGMSLAFGKEWWVARNWALGLAGQAHLASMGGTQGRTNATSYGMLLSATYN
jgi:hypothetical protein